jgi:hypothetical protein
MLDLCKVYIKNMAFASIAKASTVKKWWPNVW